MKGNQYPYNKASIWANAPVASGVYAIDSPSEWIYVGESENIQGRLIDHHDGHSEQSHCIDRRDPDTFDYEIVSGHEARRRRQDELIEAFRPKCNRT